MDTKVTKTDVVKPSEPKKKTRLFRIGIVKSLDAALWKAAETDGDLAVLLLIGGKKKVAARLPIRFIDSSKLPLRGHKMVERIEFTMNTGKQRIKAELLVHDGSQFVNDGVTRPYHVLGLGDKIDHFIEVADWPDSLLPILMLEYEFTGLEDNMPCSKILVISNHLVGGDEE